MPHRAVTAIFAAIVFSSGAASAQTDVDWSKAQTVEFVMTNFAFTPNALRLQHGLPYRLHLVNNGSGGHSFEAADLFAAAAIMPADQAKLAKGVIEVPKGGSADISFVPARAGTYSFRCSHFLHATFGMTGNAVVE